MFKNSMSVRALPSRVYQLALQLSKSACTTSELRGMFDPNEKFSDFAEIVTALRELDLVTSNGDNLALKVDKSVLKTMDTFRRYCNGKVFSDPQDLFYRISQIMVNLYESPEGKKVSENSITSIQMETYLREKTDVNNAQQNMRAWRFWAGFLGLGFVTESKQTFTYLPNLSDYLKDSIQNANIASGEYLVSDFVAKIRPYCEWALLNNEKRFNLGMANGLRTLHDDGVIVLKEELDAAEKWQIFEIPGATPRSGITHVVVK